jgi:hypothetical protein
MEKLGKTLCATERSPVLAVDGSHMFSGIHGFSKPTTVKMIIIQFTGSFCNMWKIVAK